jgi:hypothetical protein
MSAKSMQLLQLSFNMHTCKPFNSFRWEIGFKKVGDWGEKAGDSNRAVFCR